MLIPAHILHLGYDELLLQTRSWVLEHAGFHVTTLSDLEVLGQLDGVPPVDLLLLCHTLSPDDCREAEIWLRLVRPTGKTLRLVENGLENLPETEHHTFRSLDGPTPLLESIQKVLAYSE
jgi:hypothetical protein